MKIISVIGQLHTALYIPIITVVLIARRRKRLHNVSNIPRDNLMKDDEWRTSGSIYGVGVSLPVVGRERADAVSTSSGVSTSILSGPVKSGSSCQQ